MATAFDPFPMCDKVLSTQFQQYDVAIARRPTALSHTHGFAMPYPRNIFSPVLMFLVWAGRKWYYSIAYTRWLSCL